ncbi:stress responsive alpha/beta barrel protein [Mucilaginibacter oryzae]|uniref:Stress responsive alpha/beta barrel protein n=2 Tax=Bacteria TaxID=2 RepID=A0A316H456_9SPHI|nr:Dabb family protein [Mucilaginibacter oryzae]PWK74216.1 stress responsive alpha/beta barrel protein [Mucilaginibacter oryzae]
MPILQNTFVHHVHFWLNNKADKDQLIAGLNTLIPIPHIRHIHIGVPADTNRDVIDRSYDVSLLILFDSPEAQEAYQVDPTHVIFAEEYAKPLCSKVVVVDSVNI